MTEIMTYRMPFRRRRQEKTNYAKRLAFLRSGKPRLVVRKSNNSAIVQVVQYDPAGDKCMAMAQSSELKKLGWGKHGGNLPAAYLTGYLCAKKALKQSTKEAVLDIGLLTPVHGSAVFSALKGAVDAGLSIPCKADVFPSEDRIQGKHLGEGVAELMSKVKKEIDTKYGG